MLRHDRHVDAQHVRLGLGALDAHGGVVDGDGPDDVLRVRGPVRELVLDDVVVGEGDVAGRQRHAVAPLGVAADRERPRLAVRRHRPVGGETRRVGALHWCERAVVVAHEGLVGEVPDLVGRPDDADEGAEVVDVREGADPVDDGARRGRGAGGGTGGRRRAAAGERWRGTRARGAGGGAPHEAAGEQRSREHEQDKYLTRTCAGHRCPQSPSCPIGTPPAGPESSGPRVRVGPILLRTAARSRAGDGTGAAPGATSSPCPRHAPALLGGAPGDGAGGAQPRFRPTFTRTYVRVTVTVPRPIHHRPSPGAAHVPRRSHLQRRARRPTAGRAPAASPRAAAGRAPTARPSRSPSPGTSGSAAR